MGSLPGPGWGGSSFQTLQACAGPSTQALPCHLPRGRGSQQPEAHRALLQITQLRSKVRLRLQPGPGVPSRSLVHTPPSWGQGHLELSGS